MAKIDAMLRMMKEKGVERAVLGSDKPYQIYSGGRRVDGSVTPDAQLRQMLEEIVPPSLAPGLRSGSAFHFQHHSPDGLFDLGVTHDLGTLQLIITPAKAPLQGVIVPAQPQTWPQNQPAAPPQPHYPQPVQATPQYPQPQAAPPYQQPQATYPQPQAFPPPNYQNPGYPPPQGHPNYPQQQGYPAPQGYPPHPGHPAPDYQSPYGPGHSYVAPRSKVAAGLLAIFLPGLGIHRFYMGYTGIGVVFLVLSLALGVVTCGITTYIAMAWSFIEGIIILCGGMPDADGRPLAN